MICFEGNAGGDLANWWASIFSLFYYAGEKYPSFETISQNLCAVTLTIQWNKSIKSI